MYAVAVFVVGAMVPVLLAQVFLAILPDPLGRSIVSVLLAFWGMMLAATLHVSDYVSYRDIFHSGETLAPLTHRGGR